MQSAIQWFHIKQYFGCIYTENSDVYLFVYRVRFKMQDTRIEVPDYCGLVVHMESFQSKSI